MYFQYTRKTEGLEDGNGPGMEFRAPHLLFWPAKIFSRERSHDCFPGTFWRLATAMAHILKKLGPRVEEMKIGK